MLVQVVIDDSTSKVITGLHEYDRANGGTLILPSGPSFPASPNAKEIFVNTSDLKIYRRNDANTAWEIIGAVSIPQGSTPPTNPSDGDPWIAVLSDLRALMLYDSARGAWLSSEFLLAVFGHDNAYSNYLRPAGIRTPSIGTSILIPRKATITRIAAVAVAGASNKAFEIVKNGSGVYQFTLNGLTAIENNVNVPLESADKITVHAVYSTGPDYDVTVNLYGAWRY